MKKVQITAEQEKALNDYKISENGNIGYFLRRRHTWEGKYKKIMSFTPEQFSLMLNGWYEVKDGFQVGDWVKYKDEQIRFGEKISFNKKNEIIKEIPKYYKIVEKYSEGAQSFCELSLQFAEVNSHLFEKVESWQAMLLELGREKPEFKCGDIYRTSDICRTELVTLVVVTEEDKKNCKINFKTDSVKYFYPVESRIEVKNQ